jgi:UDP-2,4-diacetamido-2,4,6-trideoxy-beta-L-altropyranose hydrolase
MEKILFRTSGGRIREKELGLGHVFRCINLGYQLKSHQIQFLIEDYGSVSSLLHEHGFKKIFNLIPGISVNDDIKKTVEYILKNKITILIIDRYGLTNLYVKSLKKIVRVVVISDLKNIEFNSDLIINGFIGFNNKIKNNKFKTKCLLGPKYQILNQQYEQKQNYKKKYDLLITVGGFDANNLLDIILKKISKYENKLKIKIILGHATQNKSIIDKFVTKSNQLTIINKTNNMKKEISSTKFGICAGGITTYEFAALQIPFAIVCQYKHQIFTAKEWHKRKIAKNLGFIQKDPKKIDVFLNSLMQNKIVLNASNLVDGLGSRRVAMEILNLVKN